jgi:hypothetical protein
VSSVTGITTLVPVATVLVVVVSNDVAGGVHLPADVMTALFAPETVAIKKASLLMYANVLNVAFPPCRTSSV